MSRMMGLILTLSLLLNVTMAGLGIGYAYKVWRYRMPQGMERVQMSDTSRGRVEAAFDEMRSDMKEHFNEMRTVRRHMRDVIETEPFDMEAYDDASRQMAALQEKMGKARAEAVRGLAAGLPLEDRKALSRYLSGPFPGKHRGCLRPRNDKPRHEDGVREGAMRGGPDGGFGDKGPAPNGPDAP